MRPERVIQYLDTKDFKYLQISISHFIDVTRIHAIGMAQFFTIACDSDLTVRSYELEVMVNTEADKAVYRCLMELLQNTISISVRITTFSSFKNEYRIKCDACKYEKVYSVATGLRQFLSFHECR